MIKWNLRNRILIPALGLIFLIVTITCITSFWMSRSMLKESLVVQLEELCLSTVTQMECWMESQKQNLSQISAQSQVVSSVKEGANSQAARQAVLNQLTKAKKTCEFYDDLHVANLAGMVMASSNPAEVDKLSVADQQYFKEALGGKTVVSEVVKSRTTGNPMVIIATPIREGQAVCGVLFGGLDLNWFSAKFLIPIKILQTGYAYVCDEKGTVIAHHDPKQILQLKIADFDWGRKMQALHSGNLEYTFNGVSKSVVFRSSDQLQWRVAMTIPTTELEAPAYSMGKEILCLGLGVLVVGIVIMMLTARSIIRPIEGVLQTISAGAGHTASAAGQISAASQMLAEGSSEQAASLEETSSSLEEMSSMVQHNAESVQQANDLAKEARAAAETGAADMQSMSAAMEAIQSSSGEVSKIIKTIDEIAFQTNILALNAAVEAARAGEAGMGFAVVAEEVRNLAQRCAHSARETADKIDGALTKTTQGAQLSGKVALGLQGIVTKVQQVDKLVTEVAGASKEQSEGINQVNSAILQMDKISQSSAANAEETASAAEELNVQAESLEGAVDELLTLVHGQQGVRRAAAKAPSRKSKAVKEVSVGVPALG